MADGITAPEIGNRPDLTKIVEAIKSLPEKAKDSLDKIPTPVKLGVVAVSVIGFQLFGGVGRVEGAGPSPTPVKPEVTPNATQIVKTATKRAESYTATPLPRISATPIKTTEVVVPSKTPEPTTGNPPPLEQSDDPNKLIKAFLGLGAVIGGVLVAGGALVAQAEKNLHILESISNMWKGGKSGPKRDSDYRRENDWQEYD